MSRNLRVFVFPPSRALSWMVLGMWVVVGLTVACGGGEPKVDPVEQQRAEEFAAIEGVKQDLDARVARRAEIKAQLAEPSEVEGVEEGAVEGQPIDREALAAEVEQIESELYTEAFDLGARIAEFINSAGVPVGEELPERVLKAFRMKSDTDILLAEEHIEKGGDYAKAIEIYTTALSTDPDYERLKEALAEAEALRWMTEERFALVKKGMTEDQVKALIGPPNAHNMRSYPERKAAAWYYPKGPDRSAAGVYFRQKKEGDPFTVYQLDFNAVKTGGDNEEADG